jgi:hypothetical protein
MAYASATIPTGLLESSRSRAADAQEWCIGPFKLPVPFPAHQGHASSNTSSSRRVADVRGLVQQFMQTVHLGLHPSSGRGGTASTSGPNATGRRTTGLKLEYSDEAPRLLGKRSVAFRCVEAQNFYNPTISSLARRR